MLGSKSETRTCSMLIGAVTATWSTIGIAPVPESLFSSLIYNAHLSIEWFFLMLVTGLLLVVSSVFPMRSTRHIALFINSLVWATMTGVFLVANVVTPVTVTAPLFALWPILLMYSDAQQKHRG